MPRNTILAIAALAAFASSASAQQGPTGVWIDHTGRGAVEIAECGTGGALCGHVVWLKDGKNASACRTQIIGDAKPTGPNTWDRGWIVDPDDNSRYSVELKPVGADRLRVVGYMGTKLFSETFTWRRAPADLKRCDGKTTTAALPAAPAPAVPAPAVPAPAAPPAASTPSTPGAPSPSAMPDNIPGDAPSSPAREASTPTVTTPSTPPAIVLPPVPQSEPRRTAQSEPIEARPEVTETPAPPRRAGRARAEKRERECKLELPYITVTIPCDAF